MPAAPVLPLTAATLASGTPQRGGTESWRRQRPPAAAPAPAPVAALAGGELCEAGALPSVLWAIHEELRAYLFLFLEVDGVGCSAASCRRLRDCVWSDAAFWRAYGGPCLSPEPRDGSPDGIRDGFRRWLFHLDGAWAADFKAFVDVAQRSAFGADFVQLLSDARYVASGLMPSDGDEAIGVLVEILRSLLSLYDPAQLDERQAAEALALLISRRRDVFAASQEEAVSAAFTISLERGLVAEDYLAEDGYGSGLDSFDGPAGEDDPLEPSEDPR